MVVGGYSGASLQKARLLTRAVRRFGALVLRERAEVDGSERAEPHSANSCEDFASPKPSTRSLLGEAVW